MTGEIQNILKGSVRTTVEYDTSKRLIGVATSNLIPGPTGEAPLGKQGAFQKVEAEITAQPPMQDSIPAPAEVQNQVPQTELKEPSSSSVITENPVQVQDPSAMTSFEMPEIKLPSSLQPQAQPSAPQAVEIEMPKMTDEVVANEPVGTDENLFEENQAPSQPETAVSNDQQTQSNQMVDIKLPVIEAPQADETQKQTTGEVEQKVTVPEIKIDIPVMNTPVETNATTQTDSILNPEAAPNTEPMAEEPKTEVLPQEEKKEPEVSNAKAAENLRDIIHKHRTVIENCADAIAKIAEELKNAAKSLQELENETMQIAGTKEETTAKVEAIVDQGNTLVNEAFDRINAIASGPKL